MNNNPYAYLLIDELPPHDARPIEAATHFYAADNLSERVVILASPLADGSWVYGYDVQWANGEHSHLEPTAQNGRFLTQRQAVLYAIGFMLFYAQWFTDESLKQLRAAELDISQTIIHIS